MILERDWPIRLMFMFSYVPFILVYDHNASHLDRSIVVFDHKEDFEFWFWVMTISIIVSKFEGTILNKPLFQIVNNKRW